MSDIVTFAPVRALDRNGEAVPGAQARFFRSGTTTPATVYADVEESIAHPTPLEADSRGIFPPIYRSGQALRVEVRDSMGLLLPGFPVDPAIIVATTGGGAAQISFNPTGDIPVNNVQAAIERVQENLVAPLLAGGIGVTGNGPILANVDATNTPSGFYRFTADSTGTLPTGWASATATGTIWLIRETATNAIQLAARKDQVGVWARRLEGGSWGAWGSQLAAGHFATTAEAQAGTDQVKAMNSLNVSQAISAQVAAAYANAGAALGVGRYLWATVSGTSSFSPGSTTAGSALTPTNAIATGGFAAPAGTWQAQGRVPPDGSITSRTTLWLRVA